MTCLASINMMDAMIKFTRKNIQHTNSIAPQVGSARGHKANRPENQVIPKVIHTTNNKGPACAGPHSSGEIELGYAAFFASPR